MSVHRKGCRLLRIIAGAVVELGSAGLGVAVSLLNVFQRASVLERGGNQGRPHRLRRITRHPADGTCASGRTVYATRDRHPRGRKTKTGFR